MRTNKARTGRRRRSFSKLVVAAFLCVFAVAWLTLAPTQAVYSMCQEACEFTCDVLLGGKNCNYFYDDGEGGCYISCG